MEIQTMSVVVPNNKCINNCMFCVSHMHPKEYANLLEDKFQFYDLYEGQYIQRLEFARDNGCNTVILTGDSEPQQNKRFLRWFGLLNRLVLKKPFRCVELQTTGILLDDNYLRFLRNGVTVTTISLSVSSFDEETNNEIIRPSHGNINLRELCANIKKYDFTLRLSLNLTSDFNKYTPKDLMDIVKNTFGADQATFRVMYTSESKETPQDKWLLEHAYNTERLKELHTYIREHGRPLELLPFGATRYDVDGVSVVLDDMCMSQEAKKELKYVILRPDCKLYSKWDTKASLIF